MRHLDTPFNNPDPGSPPLQLPELRQDVGSIGEQVTMGTAILLDSDCTIVDPVVDPLSREAQLLCDLRDRQPARAVARVGLAGPKQDAVLKANVLDAARQHHLAHRRAVAVGRQPLGDLLVVVTFTSQAEDRLQRTVPRLWKATRRPPSRKSAGMEGFKLTK
jgi:hypothetical protein